MILSVVLLLARENHSLCSLGVGPSKKETDGVRGAPSSLPMQLRLKKRDTGLRMFP